MNRLPCDKCNRGFKNKNSLGSHQRSFHGIYKSKIEHNVDSNIFQRSEILRMKNERLNRIRDTKPICPLCLMILSDRQELRSHLNHCDMDLEDDIDRLKGLGGDELQQMQDPDEVYACSKCNEGCRTEDDLTDHIVMSHPTCLNCGEVFSKTFQLDKHIKRCKTEFDAENHNNRNQAVCPFCEEVLLNLYQLKRHLKRCDERM